MPTDYNEIALLTAKLLARQDEIKRQVRILVRLGSTELGEGKITKYKVEKTWVKRHERKGFTVTRIR